MEVKVMKHEVTSILQSAFSSEQIKSRKGLLGKTLDYIEGHSVIQRLNEAFESDWSFSLTEYRIMDDEVIVVGRLKVNDVVKEQFGSSNITRDSQSGKALCVGDDLKSAVTDALKKCASLLGVGLHLYGETVPKRSQNNSGHNGNGGDEAGSHGSNGGNGNNGNCNYSGNGNNGDRSQEQLVTPKQLRYILSLGRRLNMHDNAVEELALDTFGMALPHITKFQASELIQQLAA